MRLPIFGCLAFGCCAAVSLAGCAGVASSAPPVRLAGGAGLYHPLRGSWVDPQAKSGALLYVSDMKSDDVLIYSYPQAKLVGTLSGFASPRSECVDAAGDVWIADTGGDDVAEYAHGATQPKTVLNVAGAPSGCSVDPKSGSLAVSGGVSGLAVSVFRPTQHGWGSPTRYVDASLSVPGFCGYDADGNLFVDGQTSAGEFALAKLSPTNRKLVAVKLDQAVKAPGQVAWDGSALAVGDAGVTPSVVYRFSVRRNDGTKVGAATLSSSKSVRGFFIDDATLIGPDPGRSDVGMWKYPAGGSPSSNILNVRAYGAVVSPAL